MSTTCRLTERERAWFYYGLPSQPKLVARSSSTLCRFGVDGWSSDPKPLTVVGEHDIVGKWNDEPSSLRNQVLDILTREKVDWQAVDVLRIGYVGHKMPVILSISVAPDTLSWALGDQVAGHCRSAPLEHGLDVHCEIKESRLASLANAPAVLQQNLHKHPDYYHSYMYELSDRLGTSIASLDEPRREGTKGLYLRQAGGKSTEIFALTCRHVCYGERETGHRLPTDMTLPSKGIIHLPEKTHDRLVAELEGLKNEVVKEVLAEEDRGEACDKEKRSWKMVKYKQEIDETDDFLRHFDRRKHLSTRVLGHVAYTRRYEVRPPAFSAIGV
ncbi:hypothetical protein ColLi_12876 [Colletotrichum liriopes]|uniref:Uncharacterized protein n=1 Tax=Colletotrichum liriopes TaxID=708192 RepID=A0AA37H1U0_9PEZI|nr:hypothetical protein ColLi_12876 [Colletotrichum liriopes]